ncbi:hypothetical protein ON05_004425 [Acaryochloris sp. CCMEE 5410]|nr:hypothetical protein [Acaryochloris sp. CCMEE 5410]KAI9132673.1 hypothetical protein ON05_004425 [Acaryochloris sp. CCMEE 5410]
MGDIDQFIPLLHLEARKQDFESAPSVIWLSDGGEASGESTAPCSLTVLWQFSISFMQQAILHEQQKRCLGMLALLKPKPGFGAGDTNCDMGNTY